jgi:hypothetical protein
MDEGCRDRVEPNYGVEAFWQRSSKGNTLTECKVALESEMRIRNPSIGRISCLNLVIK